MGWTRSDNARVDRILRWIFVGVVASPILAIAVLWLYDEPLSAEAKALAAPPPIVAAAETNAYVYVLGLGAPADVDDYTQGSNALQELRAENRPGAEAIAAQQKTIDRIGFSMGNDALWCRPEAESCLAKAAHDRSLANLLQKYRIPLERYRALRGKPAYLELHIPAEFDSPLVSYRPLIGSHTLSMLDILLKLDAGEVGSALVELERNIDFHRRMYSGSRTMFGKVMAASMLARDVLLLADVLRATRGAFSAHRSRIAAMLRPLTPEEGDLTEVMRNEMVYGINLALNLPNVYPHPNVGMRLATSFLYKPNATANRLAQRYRAVAPLFSGGGPPPGRAIGTAKPDPDIEDTSRGIVQKVRRLVHVVVSAGATLPFLDGHLRSATRLRDVQALLALAALQNALYQAGPTNPESIAKALAGEIGRTYANPHTGKPMDYDADAHAIYFVPTSEAGWAKALTERFNGRIALAL